MRRKNEWNMIKADTLSIASLALMPTIADAEIAKSSSTLKTLSEDNSNRSEISNNESTGLEK